MFPHSPADKTKMGKNKSERKKAQAEQWRQQAETERVARENEALRKQFREGFATRNKDLIALKDRALSQVGRFDKGEDISAAFPFLAKITNQGADLFKASGNIAGFGKDPRYFSRQQALAKERISKDVGRQMAEGVEQFRDKTLGEGSDALKYLTDEELKGIGLGSETFGERQGLFTQGTQVRSSAMEEARLAMEAVKNAVDMGTSIAGSVFGAGGIMKGLKGAGTAASGAAKAASVLDKFKHVGEIAAPGLKLATNIMPRKMELAPAPPVSLRGLAPSLSTPIRQSNITYPISPISTGTTRRRR